MDYYDADYTYVQDRSYLGDNDGNKIGNVYLKDASRYGVETQTTIAGYKNLYITGDQSYSNATNDAVTSNMFPLSDPDDNKDVYFYVTFMVNKDATRNILLDEDATMVLVKKTLRKLMVTNHTMDKKQKLQIQTILKHNKNTKLEI